MAEFLGERQIPNLREQESKKYENDCLWFKQCMNWIKPYGNMGFQQVREFPQKLSNYRLLNSDMRWEDVENFCNPLGFTKETFTEDLLPFNIVPKIINELVGEELKRNDDYKPVLASQNAIISKNEKFKEHVEEHIQNEIMKIVEIEKYRISMENQGKSEEELQALVDSKKAELDDKYNINVNLLDFQAQSEILASNITDYGRYDNDLKSLKSQCWKDVLTVDEEIVYIGVERNKPVVKHVNPLFFMYHKSSEEKYIQKGDWAGSSIPMVYADVLNIYGDKLNEEEIATLQSKGTTKEYPFTKDIEYTHHSQTNNIDDMFFGALNNYMFGDYDIGSYGTGNSIMRFYHNFVWVTHLEWKAFKRVGYLDTMNEYGETITSLVDSDFEVPKEASKTKIINRFGDENELYTWMIEDMPVTLEWIHIPRIYEGTRIGRDIFINLREKPFQTTNIEDPFSTCSLGYVGRVYSANNTKPVSHVDRIKPLNTLYMIALNHLVKAIARNKGSLINIDASQVALDLSETKDAKEAFDVTLKYLDYGYNIYNSTMNGEDEALGQSRPAPTVSNADTTPAILNILNLLTWLNSEAAMIIGVSPQRMAQMVSDRVSDNQQALIQSSYITEPYFFAHNETWREINLEYLRIFIVWLKEWFVNNPNKKEFFINYNFSKASLSTVKIEANTLDESDYGIRMMLAGNTEEYFNNMKQLALAFIQNEQMTITDMSDILLSSLGGTSPYEVDLKLKEAQAKREKALQEQEKAKQEMQKQMEEKQMAMQKHLEDSQIQREEREHQFKLEELQLKIQGDKEVALIKAYQFQDTMDADSDETPDPLEALQKLQDMELKNQKMTMEERKLKLAERSEDNEMTKHRENVEEKRKDRAAKKKTN